MSTTAYQEFYTPKNKISVVSSPNTEVHVQGQIATTQTYGFGSYFPSPNVQGQISSETITVSYTLRITYDGAHNIGDRQLRQQNIPNYCREQSVKDEVQRNTGINPNGECIKQPYSSMEFDAIYAASHCLCLCCCVQPFWNQNWQDRKARFEAELAKVAAVHMNRHIARIVEECDKSVTERLAHHENEKVQLHSTIHSTTLPKTQTVELTPEQMMLLQQMQMAQAGMGMGMPMPMANNGMMPNNNYAGNTSPSMDTSAQDSSRPLEQPFLDKSM
jgi:hypothetical protein